MNRNVKWFFTIAPFLYAALIWYLSSQPGKPPSIGLTFWDVFKDSLHLIEFGILYWLIAFAFAAHGRFTAGVSAAMIFVCILFGGIDEIHQLFTPWRSTTWIDLFKDAIGVSVSYIILRNTYFTDKNTRMKKFISSLDQGGNHNGY
ncbi:VanZ family protein [Metabacillus sp. RGM 3146]|uniref:VanZ family protein n=1 Tax=Metabacillus sp. RGM 3146 TaxID=3401092 RepID=UPI003B9C199B